MLQPYVEWHELGVDVGGEALVDLMPTAPQPSVGEADRADAAFRCRRQHLQPGPPGNVDRRMPGTRHGCRSRRQAAWPIPKSCTYCADVLAAWGRPSPFMTSSSRLLASGTCWPGTVASGLIVAGQQGEARSAGQRLHGTEVLVVQRQDPGLSCAGCLHDDRS